MRPLVCPLTVLTAVALGSGARGQATTGGTFVRTDTIRVVARPGFGPGLPSKLDVVAVGKVMEVEPDVIEVAPFRGARKEQMLKYKVANVKIDDPVLGASGITRVRVGFLADA